MSNAVAHIDEEQKRRHAHNVDEHTPRCKHCKSFVSKPAPENGQTRYYCQACERWIMEYVAQTQTVKSD
jgi:transposase-like protein